MKSIRGERKESLKVVLCIDVLFPFLPRLLLFFLYVWSACCYVFVCFSAQEKKVKKGKGANLKLVKIFIHASFRVAKTL